MACNDRQLTDAQRQAGFQQQRTGVIQAVRPFSGSATIENLIDYINREMGPALRQARKALNEVYLQVADQAPSANPLAYYFSTSVVAADPTDGRIRLNAATQNTASIIRVSENNARLQTVQPWLDVMSGGVTTPLGSVTLLDAVNPGRFLRFDLNTMTDQGAYWDLGVTIIESSDPNPFVESEAVTLSFIAGVSATGSTVPVGSLSPVARDTFLGNIGTTTAPPAAVPLASIDSTSIVYDGTAHEMQRAALTGFATASQNSNATSSAEPIVTYSSSSNMSAERVTTSSTSVTVSTSVASQIEFQRAALTGEVTAAANANATTVVRSTDFDTAPWTGNHQFDGQVALGTITTSSATGSINPTLGASSTRLLLTGTGTITVGEVSGCAEGRVLVVEFTGTGTKTITHDSASADAFACPGNTDLVMEGRSGFVAVGRVGTAANWKIVGISRVNSSLLTGEVTTTAAGVATVVRATDYAATPWTGPHTFNSTVSLGQKVAFTGLISPTAISADQNNYSPTGWSTANLVRLSTNSGTLRTVTGAAAGSSGELKWLINLGPGIVSLEHESGTTFGINVNGVAGIIYDGTSARWRPIYPLLIV